MRRAVALALLLGLCGCHASGEEHYRHARARYRALVEEGRRPTDPAFDPVLQELGQVPKGDKAYAHAQQLIAAIQSGRNPTPVAPLAVTGGVEPNESPDVTAQRQACEALAKQLGAADGGARPRLEKALNACQKKVNALEEAHEKQP